MAASMLVLPSAVKPARAADLLPIRVATGRGDPGMEPLYARDLGFFKDAGLDATVTFGGNVSTILAAIAAGSVDIGETSVSPVALAHEHGIPIRIIAASGIYRGPVGNTIMMVPNDSPIKSGADLSGKIVAVGFLKDLTQYEASAWIDKTGGDSKTVRFIEVAFSEMQAALAQGRAAATVPIEPFVTMAKSTARVLANLSDTMGGPYMVAGWIASEDFIRRNPDVVKRYISAVQRSAVWGNSHPKESAEIIAHYTGIPLSIVSVMHRMRYDESGTVDPATVQRPIDLLVRFGALTPLSAKDIIA